MKVSRLSSIVLSILRSRQRDAWRFRKASLRIGDTVVSTEMRDTSERGALFTALNNAAALFQQSRLSEESVLSTITEQITKLGLRGGIAFLTEDKKSIRLEAIAQPSEAIALFRKLEKLSGIRSGGYEIGIKGIRAYEKVINDNQPVYVENSQAEVLQLIPDSTKRFTELIMRHFPPDPGIYCPLMRENRSIGILLVAGQELTRADVPVMQLFANHVSIALENASLFSNLNLAKQSQQYSERKFQDFIDQSPLSTVVYTPDGIPIYNNPAALKVWDMSLEEEGFVYQNYNILEDQQLEALGVLRYIKQGFEGKIVVTPTIMYDPSQSDPNHVGPVRFSKAFVYPIKDDRGNLSEVVVMHEDITDRVVFENALRESEEQYRTLINNVNLGIFRSSGNSADKIIQANPALVEIFGYHSIHDLLELSPISLYTDPRDRDAFLSEIQSRGFVRDKEIKYRKRDGQEFWARVNATATFDDNRVVQWIDGIIEDISEKKKIEEQLLFDAFHDPLTKLPNRALFIDHLAQAMGRATRNDEFLFAVAFLDLDRFKNVNDSLGHEAGDQLLIAIGQNISGCVRNVDTVARFSGDEFIILLEDLQDIEDAIEITSRILAELARPIEIQNREVRVTASCGIAFSSREYTAPGSIIRDADIAMYRAKVAGKNRYEIFDPSMLDKVIERVRTETELHTGVEMDGFSVYYQPILDLASEKLCGFEALVRWDHPQRGIVYPHEFLPVAEESALIIDIGKIVIQKAARRLEQWLLEMGDASELSVNINLSVKQLLHPDILAEISSIFSTTALEPKNLTIEVTENTIMGDLEHALSFIKKYQALEIDIQLDDFGTGYSSLAALHQFPFSGLKIDKSFIKNIEVSREKANFVKTIISLGASLQMDVVAEGIETQQQLEVLRSIGCERGQGFLFSKPIDSQAAEKFLKDHI